MMASCFEYYVCPVTALLSTIGNHSRGEKLRSGDVATFIQREGARGTERRIRLPSRDFEIWGGASASLLAANRPPRVALQSQRPRPRCGCACACRPAEQWRFPSRADCTCARPVAPRPAESRCRPATPAPAPARAAMTGPAFVGAAAPLAASSFVPASAVASRASHAAAPAAAAPGRVAVVAVALPAPLPAVDITSGGIDEVSQDPYAVTRFLFKPRPSALTDEDKDVAVAAGLRQIFGNAYLMEEERAELYTFESKYRCGEITAREFVRGCAKSATYRKRFFDSVSQFRAIELNFKHLLGRAPLNQAEYSKHFKIFAAGGYDAEIDSYLDSEEYDSVFGDDVLPFTRFRGTYAPINTFNRMCTMEGGWAGSDKFKPQQLVTSLAANKPTSAVSVSNGLPPIPNAEHPSKKYDLPSASLERFQNEVEVAKAKLLEVEVELSTAYANLEKARSTINPFKAMAADMDITPLYGRNYDSDVQVFAGQYIGAPKGGFGGPSGVANIPGPSRGAARVIAKKEKQVEGLKALIVDLERKVSIMTSERLAPATTPEPLEFYLDGIEVPEFAAAAAAEAEAEAASGKFGENTMGTIEIGEGAFEDGAVVIGGTAVVGGTTVVGTAPVIIGGKQVAGTGTATDGAPTVLIPVEGENDDDVLEEEVFKPTPVVVTTSRRADDDFLGPNPKELIEKLEEERIASGREFGAGLGTKVEFPGDGSEMNIGS